MTKITGSDNATLQQTDRLATERSGQADRAGKAADATKSGAAAAGTATTTASLSGAGSVLAQAMSTDDVRMDKVESLKAAIASGNYNVPAEKVADKLMDGMLG